MTNVALINLGKCLFQKAKGVAEVVDDLVLNTNSIHTIVPKTLEKGKMGAKINTIFGDLIEVPAPGVELQKSSFYDIIEAIKQVRHDGYYKLK